MIADPGDRRTFERCKLDHSERQRPTHASALHRDLLRLRREDPAFAAGNRPEGAVLTDGAFVLRWFAASDEDRLLVVNLGRQFELVRAPEPLLAPPVDACWRVLWSSDDPRYGGSGTGCVETKQGWSIPGEAAVVLRGGARGAVRDRCGLTASPGW
jgi:maltooligosyltrehalose trehalohydrolase